MQGHTKSILLILTAIFSLGHSALACPDWLKNRTGDLPLCPEGGLVPETYPVGAVIVSDTGFNGSDSQFTTDVVERVLMGAGPQSPLLILPVSDETMKRLNDRIDSLKIPKEQKEKYKKSLFQIRANSYTWQQDYMQPTVDPKTGKIILRGLQGYGRQGDSLKKIAEATKECGFSIGAELTPSRYLVNGNMGGNIETLPNGICLLGDDSFNTDNPWSDYADQVCGKNPDDRIKVPTSWLGVGHTDEVMKVVRNKNTKAPCDFSVVVASPRKALELLKADPGAKFMNFQPKGAESPQETAARRAKERTIQKMCERSFALNKKSEEWQQREKSSKGISRLLTSGTRSPSSDGVLDCPNITNAEVYRLFTQEEEAAKYSKYIQEKMDALKEEVRVKLNKKNPQCTVDFIDTPNLFFGGYGWEEGGRHEVSQGMGMSILPNPTNAISINDTIISPEPANAAFKKHIEEEYKKRGLKPEFVDTFDYAHQGMGNLHCATSTIHMCSPRGAK